MKSVLDKLAKWAENKRFMRKRYIIPAVLLALVLITCISLFMRMHIQNKYSNAASQMQEQTYQALISMTELFSRVDDPNVDVQNKLIPMLKGEYSTVASLNAALTENFGKRYAVLSKKQIEAFEDAFAEYDEAYQIGNATGLARDDMAACLAEVQVMIDDRYKPKEEVIPVFGATAEPETMR